MDELFGPQSPPRLFDSDDLVSVFYSVDIWCECFGWHFLFFNCFVVSSSRQHLSDDDCLEDKREDYQDVLCCIVYDSCPH